MSDFTAYKTTLQVETELAVETIMPRLADKFRAHQPTSLQAEENTITFSNSLLMFVFVRNPLSKFTSGKVTLVKRDDKIVEIEVELTLKAFLLTSLLMLLGALWPTFQYPNMYFVLPTVLAMYLVSAIALVLKFRWFVKRSIKTMAKEIEEERKYNETVFAISNTQKEWIANPTKCPACGFSIKTTDKTCPDCGLHF